MRDLFIAASPFEIINDDIEGCNAQVNYKGEYTNLSRFPTAFWNKQDCQVDQSYFTTLKGQKGYQDHLAVILDTSHWQYQA